jgi:hypothetical protein
MTSDQPIAETKLCPDCCESIPLNARKCRYCQYRFLEKSLVHRMLRAQSGLAKGAIFVLGGLFTFLLPHGYNLLFPPLDRTEMKLVVTSSNSDRFMRVAEDESDYCGRASASSDPEAMTCSSEKSGEMDPCWFDRFGADPDKVICVEDPWSNKATVLRLSKDAVKVALNAPLEKRSKETAGLPWALELDNHQKCLFIVDPSFGIAGMRSN